MQRTAGDELERLASECSQSFIYYNKEFELYTVGNEWCILKQKQKTLLPNLKMIES